MELKLGLFYLLNCFKLYYLTIRKENATIRKVFYEIFIT